MMSEGLRAIILLNVLWKQGRTHRRWSIWIWVFRCVGILQTWLPTATFGLK